MHDAVKENTASVSTAEGMQSAPDFSSEDELATFEGWLKYQGFDATTLEPEQLEEWRRIFDEGKRAPTPKVGLMKLKPLAPDEYRYAVAIRDDSGFWTTLWIRRAPKGDIYVVIPRAEPGWDPHTSYHRDGTFHNKSFGHKFTTQKRQPLIGSFQGTEHLCGYAGHGGKSIGAVCDPATFSRIVEVGPGVLGPRDGTVVVDLVEPGCEPLPWLGELVKEEIFKDAEPWTVVRVFRPQGG